MRAKRMGLLATLLVAAVSGVLLYQEYFSWKRFSVVKPGHLYRSGQLTPRQLESAIRKYGIKRVFSFTFENNDAEDELCRRLGVDRTMAFLPGDGVGPPDPYLQFLAMARDSSEGPILVHCSAGVQRTGGAIALFRSVIEEWPFDDAIAEMIAKGNKGGETQIDLLRSIHDQLTISERCLEPPRKIASLRHEQGSRLR